MHFDENSAKKPPEPENHFPTKCIVPGSTQDSEHPSTEKQELLDNLYVGLPSTAHLQDVLSFCGDKMGCSQPVKSVVSSLCHTGNLPPSSSLICHHLSYLRALHECQCRSTNCLSQAFLRSLGNGIGI